MTRENQRRGWHHAQISASAICTSVLCVMLAACSGTTGSAGPAGPAGASGPAGPQGPGAGVAALDITTASSITGAVTSVAISGPPVVKFNLADQNGAPLKGLPAADIGWVIAQLVPGQNADNRFIGGNRLRFAQLAQPRHARRAGRLASESPSRHHRGKFLASDARYWQLSSTGAFLPD